MFLRLNWALIHHGNQGQKIKEMYGRTKKKEPCEIKRREEETQDSHLRLTRRAPEEGEKGGVEEGVEWQGGTGGSVESVKAGLRNSGNFK